MQSIKFISLIIICATSCLALILPAVGVVPFPRELSGAGSPAANSLPNGADVTGNGALSASQTPGSGPWGVEMGSQNHSGGSVPGLPVSINGLGGFQSSPTLAGTEQPTGADQSSLQAVVEHGISKYDSLGFGIWLLLVPIWLASLLVWSITPTPKSRAK
ncbi:MAG: hypothetical protein ACK5PB_20805 [Pirellula sp.]|jgi:hypothetical protein